MTPNISRRALAAGLLATIPLPAVTAADPAGNRIPDHAEFWNRLPLPFTPAGAWQRLTPQTQAEIGAAIIGMFLAEYIGGENLDRKDQFHDATLRSDAWEVNHDILNRFEARLWTLFPTLYGPEGDHPAWALEGGFAS